MAESWNLSALRALRKRNAQVFIYGSIAFQLSAQSYGINQLRYDLRKFKGHGLLGRDGRRYAYRLTSKGVRVAMLLLFFHKRLCGPLPNSRFHHKPDPAHRPAANSKPLITRSIVQPEIIFNNVEVFLFTMFDLRTYRWTIASLLFVVTSTKQADGMEKSRGLGCAHNPLSIVIPKIHISGEDRIRELVKVAFETGCAWRLRRLNSVSDRSLSTLKTSQPSSY